MIGSVAGRAVDLARGRLDEPPDAVPAGGLERVERPAHVRIDERLRRDIRVRDRDQGREVEDHLDALGRRVHEPRVADVAELDVEPSRPSRREVSSSQPAEPREL